MSPIRSLSVTLSRIYPDSGHLGYRVIGFGSILLSKVHKRFQNLPFPLRHGLNELVRKSLSTSELSDLSLFCYQRGYWAAGERKGLFSWEQSWIAQLNPGSTILGTAAGDGREVEGEFVACG